MGNVLIVGGTGVIGKAVSDFMASMGESVYSLSRTATGLPISQGGVTQLRGDRHNKSFLAETLSRLKVDFIVDLAAYQGEDVADLIELIPPSLKCYTIMSSVAVASVSEYGPAGGVVRSMPYVSAQPVNDYVGGKQSVEATALRYMSTSPPHRITIVRTGEIIGAGDTREFYLLYRWYRRSTSLVLPDKGRNIVHPIDVRDLARAIHEITIVSKIANGIYQFAGPQAVPLSQMLKILFRACSATNLELVDIASTEIKEWFPEFYYPYYPRSTVIDTGTSSRQLGFVPIHSLEQSFVRSKERFKQTLQWFGSREMERRISTGKMAKALSIADENFLVRNKS